MKSVNKPLSICCFPISARENKIIDVLYAPLLRRGIRLENYNWLRSNFSSIDVFHIHWPDAVFMGDSKLKVFIKFFAFILSIVTFSLRRIPIVYSVHNIRSHEGRYLILEKFLWRILLPRVCVFVHMNTDSVSSFIEWQPSFSKAKHVIIPHPSYSEDESLIKCSRTDARRILGIEDEVFVVLSFGLIRPYKGLDDLILAFRSWHDPLARLIISGRVLDASYGEDLIRLAEGDQRIKLNFQFSSDQELANLIAACNIVAIAHRKLNNSGVAILTISRSRPILAPTLGAMKDLLILIGRPWVNLFDGRISYEHLEAGKLAVEYLEQDAEPDLSAFNPEAIGNQLEGIFISLRETKKSNCFSGNGQAITDRQNLGNDR